MFLLYLILFFVIQQTYSEECVENCVLLRECPSLYSLLSQRPISAANNRLLRNSICGFQGSYPKVCCPAQTRAVMLRIPTIPPIQDLLPLDVCGFSTHSRIVGGTKTDLDEFPWMALLQYQIPNGKKTFLCGGVLISKRFVLTAAHCVYQKLTLVSVRLGEYNTKTNLDCVRTSTVDDDCALPHVDVPVEKIIIHDDYNSHSQERDISLIKLKKDVEFTDFVKPVCLPLSREEREKDYVGRKLVVAGWGVTENNTASDIKMKVELPVVESSGCNSTYSSLANRQISDLQICAGGELGKDSCKGDSGGPLMTIEADKNRDIRWYAVGLVSYGPKNCGGTTIPGVYTRVGKYANWILQNLNA